MKIAQIKARRDLVFEFYKTYRIFYLEEKGSSTGSRANSRAQSNAVTKLVALHRDRYNALYRKARDEGYLPNAQLYPKVKI